MQASVVLNLTFTLRDLKELVGGALPAIVGRRHLNVVHELRETWILVEAKFMKLSINVPFVGNKTDGAADAES